MESCKKCTSCNIAKPVDDFPVAKYADGRSWHRGKCKECKKEESKLYYQNYTPEQKTKIRENERIRAALEGTWVRPGRRVERIWTEEEYRYNVRQARKLKKWKVYFTYCDFTPYEMVSEAYLILLEKDLIYSRWQFYLLIWQAMQRYKYAKIKSNRGTWERYLKMCRERKAIGRFLMKRHYINQCLSDKGINPSSLLPEDVAKYKERLQLKRGNKILVGQVLLENTQCYQY